MSGAAVRELSCGGCGGSAHRLRAVVAVADASTLAVETVCVSCGSVSAIRLAGAPRMMLGFAEPRRAGEKDDGCLTRMAWPEGGAA